MAFTRAIACAFACLLVAGCAYNRGSGDYRSYEVMGEQSVRFGVVETVRPVRIQPRDTGVGSTAGAFIGGIAGSHVGGGSGQIVGAIAGTVLGSIIGYNAEQQATSEQFRTGERVRVLTGRDAVRVTH